MSAQVGLGPSEARNAAVINVGTNSPDCDSLKAIVENDEGTGHDAIANSSTSSCDLSIPAIKDDKAVEGVIPKTQPTPLYIRYLIQPLATKIGPQSVKNNLLLMKHQSTPRLLTKLPKGCKHFLESPSPSPKRIF